MKENIVIEKVKEELSEQPVYEEVPSTKKNHKYKFLTLSIVFILLIGIVGGGVGFCYKEASGVNTQLKKENINAAIKKSEKLNPVTKILFKDRIMKQIEKSVKLNRYSSYDDGNLVFSNAVSDYTGYQKIVNILDVTAEDNKTVKYINAVVKLSEYEKFNAVSKCIEDSSGKVLAALDCINQASTSYSSYTKVMYYASAVDYMTAARKTVVNTSGYLVTDYLDGINTLMNGLTARAAEFADLSGNYGNAYNITTGQDMILEVIESLEEPKSEVEKLTNNIKFLEK